MALGKSHPSLSSCCYLVCSGAVGGLRRGYIHGCWLRPAPGAHPTPHWHDLPSVSPGAHPGGTAPPSSGTGVHSPSLAVAPRDTCAGLRQDQRPRLPRTSSLEPGTSQTQAPVHNANLHGKPPNGTACSPRPLLLHSSSSLSPLLHGDTRSRR